MMDVFSDLPPNLGNALRAALLLAPFLAIGGILRRGYAPGPLVWALLARYRWANLVFALLIAVSVGMGLALIAQERGLREGIAQSARKFELVVAAPGSEFTLMFASVFLRPSDVPLLDGATYNAVTENERVVLASPLAYGDSVGDAPVVGTTAAFVQHLSDGALDGRMFETPFEAVIGAQVPHQIGDTVVPAHGFGDAADAGAHEDEITLVGRMAPTGSPWDKAILTPVEGVWLVHGLADGHAPDAENRLGPPFDAEYFPGTPAIVVQTDSLPSAYALRAQFNDGLDTMAFFPGAVLSSLYQVMGDVRQAMSVLATVSQVLVAVAVLFGLFILTRLFQRQLALLRAVGAPARFIFAVLWTYAATLLAVGTALGALFGLAAASVLSRVVTARTDVLVEASLGWSEAHLALAFLAIAGCLALLPAALSLRLPVLEHLRR